ncbi:MAG: hypothetical protein HYY79_03840 [Betaproteobacteria bacterium]|nr:hypothetical protein [Betaproteobacteria bacterium]
MTTANLQMTFDRNTGVHGNTCAAAMTSALSHANANMFQNAHGFASEPARWLSPRGVIAALALLALVLVAGCSAVRIGYGQLDTILAWTLDEYFDLDPRQKHELNVRLDRLLEWHRYEQLPDYARFLTATKARLQQRPMTREDMVWFLDGVRARYRAIVERGVADAADILATLAPEQLHALEKHFEKVNRRFAREFRLDATAEERRRAYAVSRALPQVGALRQQDRMRRQREFVDLLKLRANRAEFLPKLKAWLSDWEQGRSADYTRAWNEHIDRRIDMYVAIDRMLTPGQRARVLTRLQDYIDDFYALSEPPRSRAVAR